MMLRHFGEGEAADADEKAIEDVLATPEYRTARCRREGYDGDCREGYRRQAGKVTQARRSWDQTRLQPAKKAPEKMPLVVI